MTRWMTILFLLMTGCSTLRDTFSKDDKPNVYPYYVCEGVEYFYQVSMVGEKQVYLKLDPKLHELESVVFPKSSCTKKEKKSL